MWALSLARALLATVTRWMRGGVTAFLRLRVFIEEKMVVTLVQHRTADAVLFLITVIPLVTLIRPVVL